MATATRQRKIVFAAQRGPQQRLLACPVEDVFFGGARGGGKTYALLGDWILHATSHGENARGIFFRRTYPELDEVQDQASMMFPALGAIYNVQKRTWAWPNGAAMKMRHLDNDNDTSNYQGHAYTWMAFDELTNWPEAKPIDKLRACLRSGRAPVPKSFRATGNPGGPGHNWVKARYVDPAKPNTPFYNEDQQVWRAFIPSRLEDNPALTTNDPDYWRRVVAAANGDEALLQAWRDGDWDIVAGGMFDDLWRRDVHVIEPFPIPSSWYVDRSFDWGSSKPYSVGWWAESDGTTAPNGRTYARGTLFRIHESYGWNGRPNEGCKKLAVEVADEVKEIEAALALNVAPGPADDSIWDEENGNCIARDMAARGVAWTRAGKRPGTRKTGWEKLRKLLKAAHSFPMEEPGLFVFNTCTQFIRTVPVLPRDKKLTDDVDTNSEDHCFAGDTLVDTEMGQVPIRDLVGRSGRIFGSDGRLHHFQNCRLIRRDAHVVRVLYADGRSVVATPDHRFLTIKNGWVEVKDLSDETSYVLGNAVGAFVVRVEPAGRADVYCLSVPGLENFSIEGGIIVHNCGDEVRYRCLQANLGHAY